MNAPKLNPVQISRKIPTSETTYPSLRTTLNTLKKWSSANFKLFQLFKVILLCRQDWTRSARKFTKWTIFRDGLAKTLKFTIFTIFRHGFSMFRTIKPNFYPFQSGAADFTILTKTVKFTNAVFFRQIFMRMCHNVSPFVVYIITVVDPREGPGGPGPPLIFRPKGRKKFFRDRPPPPLPPVWIRNWITHPRSNIAGIQRSISEVRRVNFDCKEEKHGRIYLRSFFVVIFAILAVSSRAFLRLWFAFLCHFC